METSPTPKPDRGAPVPDPSAPRLPSAPFPAAPLLGATPPSSAATPPVTVMSEPAGAPPTRGRGGPHRRFLTILAAVFVLVGSAFVGFGARDGWFARDSSSSSTAAPAAESSSDSSSTASSDATDFGAIADRVDDAIVNITTQTSQGVGAGTGMIISSKGLVLTNHHVISGAEELEIEVGGNGRTYDAHVVGYSIADDVALVQIEGVSGLPTIDTDDSVSVNEEVLVIGNALGRGGEPTVSPGVVVAIGRQITATDRAGGNGETLTGMIQVAASVQPGQSGGAVVDDDGEVVGMTTAASVNGGFRFGFEGGSDEAYAIPIARAVAAAETIQLGTSTDEIHVGPRGVMGVEISGRFAGSATGVPVSGVTDGGPADDAGISEGSTIVSIDDSPVRTADDITVAMNRYAPGDDVKVTWLDSAGSRHTAILELIEGPPA